MSEINKNKMEGNIYKQVVSLTLHFTYTEYENK